MSDLSIYLVFDTEFFTPPDRRVPAAEYRERVDAILGHDEWETSARGIWTFVHPRGWEGLRQGWKLHVSATPSNAGTVLERVATVLRDDPAAFKFAADRTMVAIMTSKNWPREGAGKFITIYPGGDEQFRRLAGALAQATDGLDGQYILSDRRVPGSRIVFYRYGEHLGHQVVNPRGFREHHVLSPEGEAVPDERQGYYHVPGWVADPYGAAPVRVLEPEGEKVTLNGRYQVERALKHSNVGGVYLATDLRTERKVIVRERRPFTGFTGGPGDAVTQLHEEARILRVMDGSPFTPAFVEQFQAWEHHYLVMDFVEGHMLRDYALASYFKRGSVASPRRLFWKFRHVILQLLDAIEAFHRRGIVLRDVTTGNVLVRPDRTVCLIDLEFAWDRNAGQPFALRINTPGFASPGQVAGDAPREEDDLYALGAVIVEMCSFLTGGMSLNHEGFMSMAALAMNEIGMPRQLLEVARGLMHPDPARRWDGAAVRRALKAVRAGDIPWAANPPGRLPLADAGGEGAVAAHAGETCERLAAFFEASAEPDAGDRLWPASPEAFNTNPVCIRFGACGPLEFVRRAQGAVPGAWLDWVERRSGPEVCPPGLYIGQAGVALTLAACGRADAARRLIAQAVDAPIAPELASLYNGRAGIGMAALALARDLGDPALLDHARRIGDDLAGRARPRRRGIAWPGPDGGIPCGLADGGSGVALFYTCLGAATGEARYWEVARQALEFEFSQVTPSGGFAFWPLVGGKRRRMLRSPHVSFGTAGVATAALRLHACTGDPTLRPWIDACARTLSFRWTNKLWQDMGMAGFGETLLDLHAVTGDPAHARDAYRMAEALLNSQVRTRYGTSFPGIGLNRVSSDFGSGASGIALFLHRLAHGGHRAFFADHLLAGVPEWAPAPARVSAEPAPGTSGAAAARRPAGRAPARATARTPA